MDTYGLYIICSSTQLSGQRSTELADDCACPADGLEREDTEPESGAPCYQAAPLHIEVLDEDFAVGYSPFVQAGRPC